MAAVRFLDGKPDYDLTYNDVFMAPNRSSVSSRTEADLTSTDGVGTPLPIVVANMTAISGRRMAETMARRGGIAILPQDIPTDVVAAQIAKVKAAHPTLETPIRVVVGSTVGDAMALIPKRAHGVAVVVDANRPVGIVSPAEFEGIDRFTQVQEVMTTDLTLVGTDATPSEVFDRLSARHQKVALVAADDGSLLGLMTSQRALRRSISRPASCPPGPPTGARPGRGPGRTSPTAALPCSS